MAQHSAVHAAEYYRCTPPVGQWLDTAASGGDTNSLSSRECCYLSRRLLRIIWLRSFYPTILKVWLLCVRLLRCHEVERERQTDSWKKSKNVIVNSIGSCSSFSQFQLCCPISYVMLFIWKEEPARHLRMIFLRSTRESVRCLMCRWQICSMSTRWWHRMEADLCDKSILILHVSYRSSVD